MTTTFTNHKIPKTRIATFDVFSVGMLRHHVSALLEFDVTNSREKIRELKRGGAKISFNAWLLKVIGITVQQHPEAAAYLQNKSKLITFNDINISMMVEKVIDDKKIPMPMVIKKANEKSVEEIAKEIENATNQQLSKSDIVLNKSSKRYEQLYYLLPGFLRKWFWHYLLRHPKTAYKQMGNVVVTSLNMMGTINGWFIHKSVHPLSFGVGSVVKKPVVINNEIQIREILNMTILLDHDVIDGAPMARFLKELNRNIEKGAGL